ncbi:MAG: bifunctional aldolase/short-chain dehydrogenase [Chitinophagaceae bacterium]|nr:bifunctional aldolase/short-chain dehydrogenase [Chitinophagaceae bacterium]
MTIAEKDQLIEDRVQSSRMLGRNKSLVLHGGGNTSVKVREANLVGEEEDILYVKGSGWDLETITREGFSPVRINHLKKLARLPELTDSQMLNELVTHQTKASAPVPSVEAILHAIIPFRFVDHTHADAVVAISNSVNGDEILKEIYGDTVIYVPYIMPGFDLSRLCATILEKELTPEKRGIILLHHGVFTYGETATESYDRMIELVGKAETYLAEKKTPGSTVKQYKLPGDFTSGLCALRKKIADVAGFPVIIKRADDAKSMDFCNRSDVAIISRQGPATPDHVIRTKRLPLVGRDIDAFAREYSNYFAEYEPLAKDRKTMLDPAPRVVLDPVLGVCAIGKTVKDATIVADIYDHTIDIILAANAIGGYVALPARDIFDVEYWELEQAKLKKAGNLPPFTGEIALVTGAASGIGKACALSLLARGAVVVGVDINPAVKDISSDPSYYGMVVDLASEEGLISTIQQTVFLFGGLDMLVLNAGIFPESSKVSELAYEKWQRVLQVNLDVNFRLLQEAYPCLKLAPKGGRVVIVGSKNVAAPGPGAAAYSVSKAALNQLARVTAMEWGKDNIRINSVHPNAVFDTGIWTEEVLHSRAMHYGLTIEEYKKNNILKTEISSRDVSELVAELCSHVFAKTTGAQIPVDGGNDRVI